ncbi:MAG: hypothetical protein ACW964_09480 [Candidatus Hodarchaeales archaeon]|jgi:hypothetical protein
MLEGYSTIPYMAGITKKIKIGVQVTCNFFRNPALLLEREKLITKSPDFHDMRRLLYQASPF